MQGEFFIIFMTQYFLFKRHRQIKIQFSYLHFKYCNISCTSDELSWPIFFSGLPRCPRWKSQFGPSTLRTWRTRRNHDGIDGFPTNFLSEFCQGDIPSQFRCNSVMILSMPRIFHWSNRFLMEPGFLFLYVASVLGPKWLFHLGRLGGDRL